jgi:hypothetical protein
MTTPENVPPQEPADAFAKDLVESGAHPVEDNADDILARMRELEAKYEALAKSQGVVTDPKKASRANLLAHVQAHANANPHADFSDLLNAVNDESVNPEIVSVLIEDMRAKHPNLDLAYVAELGRDFRKAHA